MENNNIIFEIINFLRLQILVLINLIKIINWFFFNFQKH